MEISVTFLSSQVENIHKMVPTANCKNTTVLAFTPETFPPPLCVFFRHYHLFISAELMGFSWFFPLGFARFFPWRGRGPPLLNILSFHARPPAIVVSISCLTSYLPSLTSITYYRCVRTDYQLHALTWTRAMISACVLVLGVRAHTDALPRGF